MTAIVRILQQFLDEMHRRRVELLPQLSQTPAERAPQHAHAVAALRDPGGSIAGYFVSWKNLEKLVIFLPYDSGTPHFSAARKKGDAGIWWH